MRVSEPQFAFALTTPIEPAAEGGEGKLQSRAGLVINAHTFAPGIVEVKKNIGTETFDAATDEWTSN